MELTAARQRAAADRINARLFHPASCLVKVTQERRRNRQGFVPGMQAGRVETARVETEPAVNRVGKFSALELHSSAAHRISSQARTQTLSGRRKKIKTERDGRYGDTARNEDARRGGENQIVLSGAITEPPKLRGKTQLSCRKTGKPRQRRPPSDGKTHPEGFRMSAEAGMRQSPETESPSEQGKGRGICGEQPALRRKHPAVAQSGIFGKAQRRSRV